MSEELNKDYEDCLQQAIVLQQAGSLKEAAALYDNLLSKNNKRLDVLHNLGITLLHIGQLERGNNLVRQAFIQDPQNPGMQASPKIVGMLLVKHQYWEQAYPWLIDAIQIAPDDRELANTLQRIYRRDYLKPEVFDPLANQTLIRYSPREASTYVYTIDIVGTCNLRCPSCPVGNSTDSMRSKSFMPLELFTDILNKVESETPSETTQIWLYSWGEPLLHPQLPELVKLVKAKGFSCHLSTNLNIEKGLKELIKAQPDELKISISGFSEETYSITHSKGNILLVKSNLYKLRALIDQYQAKTRVWLGHHLYKSNFHEQAEVRNICKELGFDYSPIQAFYQPLEKLIALSNNDATVAAEEILENLIVHPKAQIQFSKRYQNQNYDCELRFNQTVINADGSVAQCCSQYHSENMLGIQFLEYDRKEIEKRKYENPICKTCRSCGLDYAPKNLPESLSVEQH